MFLVFIISFTFRCAKIQHSPHTTKLFSFFPVTQKTNNKITFLILHHTRYIVRDGRYTKLIFYYFDDHKDTLDKASKRVLKYMKLDDLFSNLLATQNDVEDDGCTEDGGDGIEGDDGRGRQGA